MKWAWIAAGLGVVLIALAQYALGGIFLVAATGALAVMAMKRAQDSRVDALEDDVHPNDRYLIAPIRKQLLKIEELVGQNPDQAAVKVIGTEALLEAKGIYRQCVGLVIEKANSRKIIEQKAQAEKDATIAEQNLANAKDDDEKALFSSALASYRQQIALYAEKESRFNSIAANLAQADAALRLIVSQLGMMTRSGGDTQEIDDDLRQSLSRLQSLGKSIGETDELLENKNT